MPQIKTGYILIAIFAISLLSLFIFNQQVVAPNERPNVTPTIAAGSGCGLSTCHGTEDLSCVTNPPDVCTEVYQFGDRCRQYVSCGVTNGECSIYVSPQFEECTTCVDRCLQEYDSAEERLECESDC